MEDALDADRPSLMRMGHGEGHRRQAALPVVTGIRWRRDEAGRG